MSAAVAARRAVVGGMAAVCLTLGGGTAAWAQGTPGGEGWEGRGARAYTAEDAVPAQDLSGDCEFSLDGQAWAAAVKVDDMSLKPGADGKVHLQVRAAGDRAGCTVSLASYRTHGATWNTSGLQVFHDFDTVSVKGAETGSLDIAVPDAGCYAQVDLYRGSVKYDGVQDAEDGLVHGDLPEGPGRPVIKEKNISWWNGGTRDCTAGTAEPTPTATTSAPAGQEPAPTSAPTTTAPAATTAAPASPTTSSEPSGSAAPATPTASATVSDGPAPSEESSGAPSPSSSPATAPAGSEGDLAETGGGNVTVIAAAASVLLLAGAGLVVVRRRRADSRA
ncbi:LAETG motif-containing sortase-dependent surface protein [Streptomyces sp. NPDC057854]|uniref:LAETG motif-containing sortase-dependent surface protein n=1 Tax=unclassified Streptomyces TaxID=2593676 RepID=UPI00368988F9